MAMLIAFKLLIVKEERFLQEKFGKTYEKYRKNVPVLIPSIKILFRILTSKK